MKISFNIKPNPKDLGTNIFDSNKYKVSGFYKINDGIDDWLIHVNKDIHIVWSMKWDDIKGNFLANKKEEKTTETSEKKQDGVVAESFALKMLSIATKNDKYKEL